LAACQSKETALIKEEKQQQRRREKESSARSRRKKPERVRVGRGDNVGLKTFKTEYAGPDMERDERGDQHVD